MIRAQETTSTQSAARVRAWLASVETSRAKIAADAGVDEKTVRLAAVDGWNPTLETLSKLEAVIPSDFQPTKRRKVAA